MEESIENEAKKNIEEINIHQDTARQIKAPLK